MKILGNDVYIQRGETWSLDFDVRNAKGDPFMLFKAWQNPYLAITVTAARYAQKGDFRRTWWLDLKKRYVEQIDGSFLQMPMKMFIGTEALPITNFSIADVITTYGQSNGGRIVIDKNSDFDVTNYLFFVDAKSDGNKVYKYVSDYKVGPVYNLRFSEWSDDATYTSGDLVLYISTLYCVTATTIAGETPVSDYGTSNPHFVAMNVDIFFTVDTPYEGGHTYNAGDVVIYKGVPVVGGDVLYKGVYVANKRTANDPTANADWIQLNSTSYVQVDNGVVSETWEEYNFRVVKQFDTKEWTEQGFLFDIKVLAGQSVAENVYAILEQEGDDMGDAGDPNEWSDQQMQSYINQISDKATREELQAIYDSGMPLMPSYDTKALILEPTNLYVSSNIQGGL